MIVQTIVATFSEIIPGEYTLLFTGEAKLAFVPSSSIQRMNTWRASLTG